MELDNEILSKLKFIGKLNKGEKINIKSLYIQPDNIITSISRTLQQDNRINTLNFIQTIVSQCFEILSTYQKSPNPSGTIMYNHLVEDLTQASIGLKNLKSTYKADIKFCCDIDTLIQLIHAKLSDLSPPPTPPLSLSSSSTPSSSSSPS